MPVRKSLNSLPELHEDFRALRFLKTPKNPILLMISNWLVTILFYLTRLPKGVSRKTFRILMRDGHRLTVHHYYEKGTEPKSTIFYFAGGGFLMKPTHLHQSGLCHLIQKTSSNAFLIRYRLAPRHQYPQAFEDALDAYLYLIRKSKDYHVNLNCFGLGGDSAGGNLSAALGLYLRDHQLTLPKFELLLYPALTNDPSLSSRRNYSHAPMLDEDTLSFIYKRYYSNKANINDPVAYPLQHPNLNLPFDTYIEACEFDPLHDEAVLYHKKLIQASSKSELHEILGAPHGFDAAFWSPTVQKQLEIRCDFIRKHQ